MSKPSKQHEKGLTRDERQQIVAHLIALGASLEAFARDVRAGGEIGPVVVAGRIKQHLSQCGCFDEVLQELMSTTTKENE